MNTATRPLRSLLFVPGNKLDWMVKAPRYGADALIFDLEDATPPAEKVAAREMVRQALDQIGARQTVLVRVNALDTGLMQDDLNAVVSPNLYGVLLPKVSGAEEVAQADAALLSAERRNLVEAGRTALVPLLETAVGMRDAYEAMRASARVEHAGGIVAKDGDTARALSLRWTRHARESLYVRSKLLLDARAAGLHFPAGGLWTDIPDLDGFRAFAEEMRDLGYAGLLVIHPSHVPIANQVFSPSAEELVYWKGLVAAYRDAVARGSASIQYQGALVDVAMARTAEMMLDHARQLGLPAD